MLPRTPDAGTLRAALSMMDTSIFSASDACLITDKAMACRVKARFAAMPAGMSTRLILQIPFYAGNLNQPLNFNQHAVFLAVALACII